MEYYNNKLFDYTELVLRKLYLNYDYLFKPFDNKFLFINKEAEKNNIFESIQENMKQIMKIDKEKIKKETAEIKFKYAKKIFCNSLWIDNNHSFIEEVLWRFLISSPKTFNNFFDKEPTPEVFKLMLDNGFIKNKNIYKRMTKRLHKHIKTYGK